MSDMSMPELRAYAESDSESDDEDDAYSHKEGSEDIHLVHLLKVAEAAGKKTGISCERLARSGPTHASEVTSRTRRGAY